MVGYYRLKGYCYPFPTPMAGRSIHKLPFLFSTAEYPIWEWYVFDQELRNIIFDGIISIEVFIKSSWLLNLPKQLACSAALNLPVCLDSVPKSIRMRLSASPRIISDLRCHSSSISRAPTAIHCHPSGR
ncbi:Abi family protein [Bifidobacterium sp. ESL0827]|uniref:Abi family protein n=1 Tax=Bifidobacterium sp. ESL0827 TaxID=3448583 RepID=UPI0040432727